MKLNSQQKKAKEHNSGPLLILAGAGTGKTTTIVERMAFLISDLKTDPSSILALTFSVKAAEHLKEKLVEKVGPIGQKIHSSTFHSFAQSVIDEFKSELNLLSSPQLMNDSEINFLIREHFNELEYINITMRSIRKIQYDCNLLHMCNHDSTIVEEIQQFKTKRYDFTSAISQKYILRR